MKYSTYSQRLYTSFFEAIYVGVVLNQYRNRTLCKSVYRRILSREVCRKKKCKKFTLQFERISPPISRKEKLWRVMALFLTKYYDAKLFIYDYLNRENLHFQSKEGKHEIKLFYNELNNYYQVIFSAKSLKHINKRKSYCKQCGHQNNLHPTHRAQERFSLYCSKCDGHFNKEFCFFKHGQSIGESKPSVCEVYFHCPCGLRIKRGLEHVCNLDKHCYQCGKVYNILQDPQPHFCYIKKPRKVPFPKKNLRVCFFDIETRLDNEKQHVPNLLCGEVYILNSSVPGDYDRETTLTFFGDNCIASFFKVIFSKEFENATFISHNGSKFDNFFIFNYAIYEMKLLPKCIFNGNQILTFSLPGKRKFLDSFLFISSPLRRLPSMFGFSECKGYFPYLMNKPENYDYVGPVPEKEMYGFENMSKKDKALFLEWYNTETTFNFKKELIKYCQIDCIVLAKAFLKFRDLVLETTNKIDLILENVLTISSLTMKIYRINHLPILSLLNIRRDRPNFNVSRISTGYIDFVNNQRRKEGLPIYLHDRNHISGEQRVGTFFLDGFIPETKQILEVDGCYFHNPYCTICKISPSANSQSRVYRSQRKEEYLRKWGFDVSRVSECQIPISLRKKIWSSPEREKLVPGQAIYGGRSEIFNKFLFHTDSYNLCYSDVQSLYPYVLRTRAFPVGPLEIIRPEVDHYYTFDINALFGLVFCRILPPQNLFVPLLPFRVRKKTVFALCRVCAEENKTHLTNVNLNQGDDIPQGLKFCYHSEEERSFVGVYTSEELKVAVNKCRYRILNVYEIWHFKKQSTDLFSTFVDTFFKYKIESSGYPNHVKTETEKKDYIERVKKIDGIELSPEKNYKKCRFAKFSQDYIVFSLG